MVTRLPDSDAQILYKKETTAAARPNTPAKETEPREAAALEEVVDGAAPVLDALVGSGVVPVVALPLGNDGVLDKVLTTSPVAFVHETEESMVAALLRVISAHCRLPSGEISTPLAQDSTGMTNLEEKPVPAVELDLDRRVHAVLNAGNVGRGQVDREAECALALHLEEWDRLSEVGEVLRVLRGREEDAD